MGIDGYFSWEVGKIEKLLFNFHFLNYDISVNKQLRNTKYEIHTDELHMEGTVSQIYFYMSQFLFYEM